MSILGVRNGRVSKNVLLNLSKRELAEDYLATLGLLDDICSRLREMADEHSDEVLAGRIHGFLAGSIREEERRAGCCPCQPPVASRPEIR